MANIMRTCKDRLFCALFGSKERKNLTLELYNALNGTSYTNAEDIQINTIEDVVYFGMRNDVSFLLANEINLYEQQSTWSPNVPLRAFCYVEHVVESYLYGTGKNNEVYGNKLVKIPTPKIVVLYNVDESNDKSIVTDHEMRLSDAFETPGGDVEVIVHAYNINTGNHLPSICTPLNDYSSLVGMYRKNARKAKTKEERIAAADAALNTLPDGEVKSYILSQRSEVIDMLLTEYDEKKVMECLQREAKAEGKAEAITDLIKGGIITLEQGAMQLGISVAKMRQMISA